MSRPHYHAERGAVVEVLLVGFCIALICCIIIFAIPSPERECVRYETEHRGEWIQMMSVGSTLIPITHPAHDVEVCKEYADEGGDE